ncbi:MAG TPA: NAD(P)-dependent oxidoreductase [Bacteroidales bacterium]|nr:NAD(P)-dependent oxidoreductase [Bacteroidales bacterium]
MKIGILRETKTPVDTRVPLTPQQCKMVQEEFPGIAVIVQPSLQRCFPDELYRQAGISVNEDLSDCDILFGVKEVKTDELLAGKTYCIFSHTAKKQEHNRKLLKAIIEKKISLIDYELLTDVKGIRIIGFGRWAGLVGAYHGIRAYGIRLGMNPLPLPHEIGSLQTMMQLAAGYSLPHGKIALTGDGRVAGGAEEMLNAFAVRKISVDEFLEHRIYEQPVYVQLDPEKYNKHRNNPEFDLKHFFQNPHEYKSDFQRFCSLTDILIMAAYWDPRAPLLFEKELMLNDDFRIRVIADITCDLNGSVPSTIQTTRFEDPYYDYNPVTGSAELPFLSKDNITVMAIDNLPNGLPREASTDFGHNIMKSVLPLLSGNDPEKILERATITRNGNLTQLFNYLDPWVNQI